MTWVRILFGVNRLLCAILLVSALLASGTGHATEVRLSNAPIQNILPTIVSNSNTDAATDAPFVTSFTVRNDTAESIQWRFRTEVLEPLSFVFHRSEHNDPFFTSPFRARPQLSHASQGPTIRSSLVTIEPGESILVTAQFERRPGPELFPISLVSEYRSDQVDWRNSMAHGIYFGAMLVFITLFVLSANIIASPASIWFGLYLASMTALNAHSYGYLLTLLHIPPEGFYFVIRGLQAALMVAYLAFAMSFLRAWERYPLLWRTVCCFFVAMLITAALEIMNESAMLRRVTDAFALGFLLIGICSAYLALRYDHYGGRFFAAGFGLLLIAGVMNYIASIPAFAEWNDLVDRVTLALQSCDALVFGGAIFYQIYGLKRQRDAALNETLVEVREKLTLNQKLRRSETNLQRARNLAERHRSTLASTSHDLRQPIASLRVSLEQARDSSPELAADLSSGIEFLDSVLGQTLETTRPETEDQPPPERIEDDEPVALQMVLENVQRMFAAEAQKKGLELKVVPSTLSVKAPIIDLIRIVSNLTANAIRYTDKGGVLVGARRCGDTVAIEVWDTGRGIAADKQNTVMMPYERGDAPTSSKGEGLGLSIVQRLVQKNGFTATLRSKPGKGSVFRIGGLRPVSRTP